VLDVLLPLIVFAVVLAASRLPVPGRGPAHRIGRAAPPADSGHDQNPFGYGPIGIGLQTRRGPCDENPSD
jgi:hypothetical protein